MSDGEGEQQKRGAALLEARGVSKVYRGVSGRVTALDNVSLAVPKGSFCALAGPSGSGKTTLLALLGALDRPSSGAVLIEGQNTADASDVHLARLRRRMGFVFQDLALIPRLPVWENVTYPLVVRGLTRRQRYELAESLMARFGLAHRLGEYPAKLSGGEQQRVALARALSGQPDLLLADEPTSHLDHRARAVLAADFAELHRRGTTVIVATHDRELAALAGHVYELEEGRLKPGDQ